MPARPAPKPWPMKWIILAILVGIVPYTWITLKYRKPGPAHEPYADNKARAQELRLEQSGLLAVPVGIEWEAAALAPRQPEQAQARPTMEAGGLPEALRRSLLDQPILPAEITAVEAPAALSASDPYPVFLKCRLPEGHAPSGAATAYVGEEEVVLVVEVEAAQHASAPPAADATARLVIPAGTFAPGTHRVVVVATGNARQWTVDVREGVERGSPRH